MTEMVWDLPAEKIYETGVDRAVLFPMTGPGVPWNGLVSVSNDVSGGESEELYYDGAKYLDVVDAEGFQATISAFGAPREFAPCEGVIKDDSVPGMYIPFGPRSKFNMSWRTRIANEPGDVEFAYKLHILYNATVMPTARTWQTLSDTTSPDVRSFQVKATPACGRSSYFVFDSRECDLSALEEQMYVARVLPFCSELAGVVGPPPGGGDGGGGGGGGNPDAGCFYFSEDFESYYPGQELTIDVVDAGASEELIHGLINDGLDTQELVANGTFTVNDSTATVVGSGPVLADASDTTYIDGPNGDLGYTIALPQLVGYVPGATFELHIRLSVTGDVSTDDPDGQIDADAQVFITTDATGDDAVGGFSDGNENSMSFVVQNVDGTIDDYVVPLDLSSWIDTSVDQVAAALEAGAYLNVVALNNNNFATTPETRVYEASVVMLDNTDSSKSLRVIPGEDEAYVKQYVPDQTTPESNANTSFVDFLVKRKPMDTSGVTTAVQPICDWTDLSTWPGTLAVELSGDNPVLVWRDQTDTVVETLALNENTWYTASVYWTWGAIEVKVYAQGDPATSYAHWTETITSAAPPVAFCAHKTGIVINGDVTYEVSLDNAAMQIHCHEPAPSVGGSSFLHPGTLTWDTPSGIFDTGTMTGALPLQDGSDSTYIGIESDGDGSSITYINRAKGPVYETYSGTPSHMTVRLRADIQSNDPVGGARVSIAIQDTDGSPAVILSPGAPDWVLADTGGVIQDFTLVMTDAYFAFWGTTLAAIASLIVAGTARFVIQLNVSTTGTPVHSFVHMYHLEIELS